MSSLALVESATSTWLVAGGSGGWLAGMATDGGAWAKQTGGGASNVTALAAGGGGGVCYATTAAGRVETRPQRRADHSPCRLTAKPGSVPSTDLSGPSSRSAPSVALSGRTSILAPGMLLLQKRPAGESSWHDSRRWQPGSDHR